MSKIERFDKLKSVFKQILALSNEDKTFLMGYLLISPWHSITWKRYKRNHEPMVQWLNDRLLNLITNGKEGSKSIVSGEGEVQSLILEKKSKV